MTSLKDNKTVLNGVIEKELFKTVESKINTNNIAALLNFSQLFSSSNASKPPLQFIERRFQMFVDSTSFLELDFKSVSKILSSSELNVDSEMEVFNAVCSWLGHNKERCKYTKDLFLKIRILFLSDPALKLILENISYFIDDFAFINEVMKEKNKGSHSKKFKSISRYCTRNSFDIVFCGGKNSGTVVSDVYSVKAHDLQTVKKLPKLKTARLWHEVVCIKGEIFVFGGNYDGSNNLTPIEKYSSFSNAWETIAHMPDERSNFSTCSFMGNAYITGGLYQRVIINSCLVFDPVDCSLKELAFMNERRCNFSSAVFEGKIVVSGGFNNEKLNTVESYDHVAKSWTNMPNMVLGRDHHKSVAIKNKFYVCGGFSTRTCEVYDSTCKKFVLLKSPNNCLLSYSVMFPDAAVSIGSKIYVFYGRNSTNLIYDTEKNTWSEEFCEVSRYLSDFNCVKVPQC